MFAVEFIKRASSYLEPYIQMVGLGRGEGGGGRGGQGEGWGWGEGRDRRRGGVGGEGRGRQRGGVGGALCMVQRWRWSSLEMPMPDTFEHEF